MASAIDSRSMPFGVERPIAPERRRFTVAEFERMDDAGVFAEWEKVELIDGVIFRRARISSRHAGCVNWLNRALSVQLQRLSSAHLVWPGLSAACPGTGDVALPGHAALSPGHTKGSPSAHRPSLDRSSPIALVAVQNPIDLGLYSEPIADIVIARYRPDDYGEGHPAVADLLLVIEVVDGSPHHDRQIKLPTYARAGVPEVWLVDLNTGCVEVHRCPAGEVYRERQIRTHDDFICPEAIPSINLSVAEILHRTPGTPAP